jgi:hypothetical protein
MLKEFNRDIRMQGIARKNRFDILIDIPQKVQQELTRRGIRYDAGNLAIRCYSTQIPPKSIASTDVKTAGFNQKIPYSRTFDDVTTSFVLDKQMKIKKIFDVWQEVIAPNDASHVAYLDDITTDVVINQLNNKDVSEYAVTLKHAYPIVVNSLDYQTDDNDSYQVVGVTWTFKTVVNDTAIRGVLEVPAPSTTVITDEQGFNVVSIVEFLNKLASFSLQGEALNWYGRINNYIRQYTGGYGVDGMAQLIKRLKFSVDSNQRFLESDRTNISTVLDDLRRKLGF